jgi:mono/diheme cytochrome c family protein
VLRFNHAVHMKPDLRGAGGEGVTLACATCHTPAEPARGGRTGGLMRPIAYKQDCASCHPLFFDPLIDAQAPHDKPELVHAFVDAELRRFIAANPAQVGRAEPVRGRIPENFPDPFPATPARTAPEWIAARTSAVESYLWTKTCSECHTITGAGGAGEAGEAGTERLPQITPTAMKSGWMPHARFDHRTHQLATCASCHEGAAASTETSDVLVPAIATCRRCHNDTRRSAEARCYLCHDYHDWTKPAPAPAGFELRELTR